MPPHFEICSRIGHSSYSLNWSVECLAELCDRSCYRFRIYVLTDGLNYASMSSQLFQLLVSRVFESARGPEWCVSRLGGFQSHFSRLVLSFWGSYDVYSTSSLTFCFLSCYKWVWDHELHFSAKTALINHEEVTALLAGSSLFDLIWIACQRSIKIWSVWCPLFGFGFD